jgi:outer membrane lipoprotein-sorting protein
MKILALIFVMLAADGFGPAPIAMSFAAGLLGFNAVPAPKPADAPTLESVLQRMDTVAANFHTAQAEFEWDYYQKVIDEIVDVETGTIYYRRSSKELEMMAAVKKAGSSVPTLKPEPKYVLFSNGVIRMYQPKPDQVTVFDLGKNHSDFESYVVLGFGGSGQDLQKAFDVTYVGSETVGGVASAKLQLIPKSDKVRNTYNKIFLWIDLERGVSVQQQFFTPQQDFRLCKFSSIKINEKIGDDVFKLKTTGKTQIITPTR